MYECHLFKLLAGELLLWSKLNTVQYGNVHIEAVLK